MVRGGKTLSRPDLEANGVYSRAAVADIVGLGQGAMPGFGETCAPKGKCTFGPRLTESEITAVSLYVLDEANADSDLRAHLAREPVSPDSRSATRQDAQAWSMGRSH